MNAKLPNTKKSNGIKLEKTRGCATSKSSNQAKRSHARARKPFLPPCARGFGSGNPVEKQRKQPVAPRRHVPNVEGDVQDNSDVGPEASLQGPLRS
ncbi:ubiquitin-fold modifier 1 isoform X1 [Rhipicephalus microplus]|uniref:ubiquitin-fold modifier 1 isoform X1 n=1 Tax=Rhipicephalus microplus TaxID=6941 RepID=UPI003F6CCC1B